MFAKIKKFGFPKALQLALKVIGDKIGIHILKLHYLRLNIDIESIESKLSGFDLDVKKLEYGDFEQGDQTVFKDDKMQLYKHRFLDSNYHAYGIIEQNRLVYSTWFSVDKFGLPMVKKYYKLLPNEGLLEDSYCHPEARGRGFHSKMNLFRIKKLYELGKDRAIVMILEGNDPAMKVQLKSGFEDVGVFYVVSVWGIKFCTLNKAKYDKR